MNGTLAPTTGLAVTLNRGTYRFHRATCPRLPGDAVPAGLVDDEVALSAVPATCCKPSPMLVAAVVEAAHERNTAPADDFPVSPAGEPIVEVGPVDGDGRPWSGVDEVALDASGEPVDEEGAGEAPVSAPAPAPSLPDLPGYEVAASWLNRRRNPYRVLRRVSGDGASWLAQCGVHGATTPASRRGDADAAGRAGCPSC